MQILPQPGGAVLTVEAANWSGTGDPAAPIKLAVNKDQLRARADPSLLYSLGQLYGIVRPGMLFAEHVFEGLRRGMLVRDDKRADTKKLAVSWAAKRDARLVGSAQSAELEYLPAPPGRVFVVYVSPNQMLNEFPDLYGWVEHWAWVAADAALPGAPVAWDTRFDRKMWSKVNE